jgi:2-dehydro-3-deoxyphosphogluconate aldolase / (4S)-4-hydroxy-2-oxoglutarate aldolase
MSADNELARSLRSIGVVPVVTVTDSQDAAPLADALRAGGLPCVEITYRANAEAATATIERIRRYAPDLLVGAGTVLSAAHADAAITAGASFVVAPGFNPAVVKHVASKRVPMMPGVATPSEIELALAHGIQLVKVFPVGALGGVPYLQALAAPYPMMHFVPTGGITPENLAEYLQLPSVAAVGGTWLAKPAVVQEGDWATVERLSAEAVGIVRAVRAQIAEEDATRTRGFRR